MKTQRTIYVYADWLGMSAPMLMGLLRVQLLRKKEVFDFTYDREWLRSEYATVVDPSLMLYEGTQYLADGKLNFGMFLDSAPDRWGRTLMQRREAIDARHEQRPVRLLGEADFLLGVFDGSRMGGLRFKDDADGPFQEHRSAVAVPPWTYLRKLEQACRHIERSDSHDELEDKWFSMLIDPGSSLGGARPKSNVVDAEGQLWIAKFPSRNDHVDVGAWEYVTHQLAQQSGITVPEAKLLKLSDGYHTFLTKRFDRSSNGARIHVASAMTMLGRIDGEDHAAGVSYLDIVEVISKLSPHPLRDLEQLFRRIVFNILVSNTDDHLRNHAFILRESKWTLSPAYDMNPEPLGRGLRLNISEFDNSLSVDLARSVADMFRIDKVGADTLISEITKTVQSWNSVAEQVGIARNERETMKSVFEKAK